MKKYLLSIFLILFISAPANAGITFFGVKGEVWRGLDSTTKYFYLQGLFDGLALSGLKIKGTALTTNITIKAYSSAIDELYADHRNALIPVMPMLRIVTLRLKGRSKEFIEKELIDERKHSK